MAGTHDYARGETLRNGLAVTIRAIRPDDRERIARAIGELDKETIYMRLFRYKSEFTEAELTRLVTVDPAREAALIVTLGAGADEIVIGSGRYFVTGARGGGRAAEIAFVVEEDYQGLGIAGRLLTHLTAVARQRGITEFEADVLAENRSMLAVFARSGLPMTTRREDGVIHVVLSLLPAQP